MANLKFNPVVWFEIYVEDIDRATRFYENVLNIRLEDASDPTNEETQMRFFPGNMEWHGTGGALVKMKGVKAGGGNVLVYFACEDCGVEEGRVEAAGGKIIQPKTSIGEHGFCAIVQDTEGNVFGLHSMK